MDSVTCHIRLTPTVLIDLQEHLIGTLFAATTREHQWPRWNISLYSWGRVRDVENL